jgi:hypothetical protein
MTDININRETSRHSNGPILNNIIIDHNIYKHQEIQHSDNVSSGIYSSKHGVVF